MRLRRRPADQPVVVCGSGSRRLGRAICTELGVPPAGAGRAVPMDLHAPQIQGFFRVPVDDLYAMPILVEAIRRAGVRDPVVVSPDSGYAKMARRFARRLGGRFALADKTRSGHDEEAEVFGLLGDVAGHDAVLVDDFVASSGTLVEAAERLVERGARSVIAAATHAVFSGDAAAKLAASA